MTAESQPSQNHRRADIQGLRAVAVLAVVMHHAWTDGLPGGFVGVDIFFVLSGFLITGILMREMDGRRFSLVAFYKRRIRRLFPALFVVLAFSLIAGALLLSPGALKELALTQFFTNLFLSNLAFIRISGYFDPAAALRPLLHTWSLGVEEQFYLLFPPILLLLHKFARRLVWPALILLALWSLHVAQDYLAVDTVKAFYHPFARAMELLIGALCVGFMRHVRLNQPMQQVASWLGLVAIAASLVVLNSTTPFPGYWALLPCLGTAAMLVAPEGTPNRWLGIRPMIVVGDMSYSLYLWHWPLLVYGHMAFGPAAWVTALAVVLALGLAWLSRRYVEEPYLRARPPAIWLPALAATAASILICVVIYNLNGLPQRFNAPERALFAAVEDYNPDRDRCHKRSSAELPYDQTCIYGDRSVAPSVAIWSDSIGAELAPVLGEALAGRSQALRSITASGCPAGQGGVGGGNCGPHRAQILAGIKADPNLRTVILVASYLGYAKEPGSGMPETMLAAAAELKAAGKQVVIILPLPVFEFDPPSEAGLALRFGRDPAAVGLGTAEYDRANAVLVARLSAFAAEHDIAVLNSRDLLCRADLCPVYDPDVGMLYFDHVHLSLTGARLLVPPLMRTIEGPRSWRSLTPRTGTG
ncbi:MAG: acyltransferase family protein [Brevundimonas sp.]